MRGTHKPKSIHQILGWESALQFCYNWLTIFSHCCFIDAITSSCTYLVTKPNVPIWSTNVPQICYPKNSILIFKFVTQQRVSLSWAKLIESMEVGEHITLETRVIVTIHLIYILLTIFWFLLWNHTQKCHLDGQIWSNNGLFPRMAYWHSTLTMFLHPLANTS